MFNFESLNLVMKPDASLCSSLNILMKPETSLCLLILKNSAIWLVYTQDNVHKIGCYSLLTSIALYFSTRKRLTLLSLTDRRYVWKLANPYLQIRYGSQSHLTISNFSFMAYTTKISTSAFYLSKFSTFISLAMYSFNILSNLFNQKIKIQSDFCFIFET
jgi:hypothetical protein